MAPQDTYIEEDEDFCPLCIEEFDLSDRNFKPCPCGYQLCQFCFNNIKTNMNNLCPACRRPYDEKKMQWKVVTHEEVAEFRANIQKNQKKRAAEQRQKEVQKREVEKENRKSLVGVRVVQKNLVYVTGLTPTVREDELLKTLRKLEFFGQYGNIQKISISNRKSSEGQNQALGIYVTFEKKEDAARCIQAVNGSQNGDRVLRAQLGTTKYCSAWLRHEQCTNRQCMFLHELGEEEDSYTRQDLSSMNSISSQVSNQQRPSANTGSSRSTSRQQVHPSPQPVAQPMVRSSSKDDSENGDGSALPSSASWARNMQARSRRESLATSGAAPSPAISHSLPISVEKVVELPREGGTSSDGDVVSRVFPVKPSTETAACDRTEVLLYSILKSMERCDMTFAKASDASWPPLFDSHGWQKRRAMREEENSTPVQDEAAEPREPSEAEPESSGSLALGGEPEDREPGRDGRRDGFDMRTSHTSMQRNDGGIFGAALNTAFGNQTSLSAIGRAMTPQGQGIMRGQGAAAFVDHMPPGLTPQTGLFQGQGQNQGQGQGQGQNQSRGHNRQGSRFSFANESRDSASTAVKLAANPRIMAQQTSMMPSTFHSQATSQYYGSSMPGPPPGLKSTGTPPSMFPHSFGSGVGPASKDNDLRQMINRSRAANPAQAHDGAKREFMFSYPNQFSASIPSPAPAPNFLASLYGTQPGAFSDFGSKQKKKGKKHRLANTSSSGGGGLVDLADPSILQARMQHQQQSNAGVGQGLFGGQSQGGYNNPSLMYGNAGYRAW